ncbi:hypothetical protein [Xanthomonas phage BUDD]|nr:hypothetical protein [Xanthomonas phage BUDD]
MKVYQAYYEYTETYCHPDPDQWSDERAVLCTTLDESLAQEIADKYNVEKGTSRWFKEYARVESFDLITR